MAVLQVKNVQKRFGKKPVLVEVSLSLETGQLLGIFGRNGSGKSTLLKILFGSLRADVLEMTINNRPISAAQVIPGRLIAYVPQHPFLPAGLRVRDLIPIYARSERAQDAIFYTPQVAAVTSRFVGQLSHGERKFLETVLIAHGPHPFLLLDEPFSMLDPLQIEAMKNFLGAIKDQKGIIITDHYYADVLDISDKKIILAKGISQSVTSLTDLKNFEYLRGE